MTEVYTRLQALLDAQMGKGKIFNIVAAVQSYDRSLDFVGAAGIADPDTGAAMTAETPYFIASVTKMYTAAVVMRLSQAGRVDLEAPITEYLPEALTRGIHVYKGTDYSTRIKVVELLNQTSGLPDYETGRSRGGKSVIEELKAGHDREVTTPDAIEIVRGLAPRFSPGTPGKAYYSNANYRLLGAIIEAVTGKSMAENFSEHIFTPLDLRQTYLFDWRQPNLENPPATIYLNDAPVHVPKYLASNTSDGGLVSTASECVTFLRAFFEGQLFDSTLMKRMQTWNLIFFPLRYGYGLMNFRLPRLFTLRSTPEFSGHSGSTGSFAFCAPERSLYLAGTLDQIASPAKAFTLMINLANGVG